MLLVLFNAAISNLIMFRNNFALNRNVANMFTVRWDITPCLSFPFTTLLVLELPGIRRFIRPRQQP